MKRIVVILIPLVCIHISNAQIPPFKLSDCDIILKNAETTYQAGHFLDCIRILEEALDSCDYSRKEKELALELLAKAYVETGDNDKAEATVLLLLQNFPHYELKEAENPEMFNRLVNKHEIHPLFTIGAKNTANWLRHKTTKVYSVLDGLDYSAPLEESGYWFTYYGMAEYEFVKNLSVNAEIMFFWSTYSRNFNMDPTFELSYWEKSQFVEFPIYLKKYFHLTRNMMTYASAGIGPFFTFKSLGNVTLKYTTQDVITGKNSDFDGGLQDINMLPLKNTAVGQWNAGAGIGYRIKNLRMFLDVRYLGCIGSITAPEKSDEIPALRNDFFYIEQEMKINQFEVGATISYTFLNSVKRKTLK